MSEPLEQTAGTLWGHLIARAHTRFAHTTVDLWMAPAIPLRLEDNRLVVAFPPELLGWVRRRYGSWIGEQTRDMGLAGARLVSQDSAAATAQEESTQ